MSDMLEQPNPFGFDLSKGVYTGSVDDLLRFRRECGQASLDRLLDISAQCVQLSRSCVSMQYGYSRSVSSASSTSSGRARVCTEVKPSVGLTTARLDAISKVKNWRPSGVPDGLCYTKLFKDAHASSRAVSLGSYPTLSTLSRVSLDGFLPFEELRRHRMVSVAEGVLHVKAGGDEGVPFLSGVRAYVDKVKTVPGSVGERVKQSDVQPASGLWRGSYVVGGSAAFVGGVALDPGCVTTMRGLARAPPGAAPWAVVVEVARAGLLREKLLSAGTKFGCAQVGGRVLFVLPHCSDAYGLRRGLVDYGLSSAVQVTSRTYDGEDVREYVASVCRASSGGCGGGDGGCLLVGCGGCGGGGCSL